MQAGDAEHGPEFHTNRCTICALNWPDTPAFGGTCKKCGCAINRVTIRGDRGDRAMTMDEAYDLWNAIRQYEATLAAEAKSLAARDAEALERLIRAASAALNYDIDRWMEATPEEMA